MEYEYSPSKKFVVSEETLIKVPTTFDKSGFVHEMDSITYFYNLVETYHSNKNAVILDIGAQCGLFTLYAKYLPDCKFYAFEPFYDSFKCLNDNLQLNKIDNVITYNCGLGSSNEIKILKVPEHKGLNTFGENPLRFSEWKDFHIPVMTIDELFLDKLTSLDYIKCDTEGWEFHILKGAEKCLMKWKPELFFEINETNAKQCSVNINELINYLSSLGYYHVKTIDNENYHFSCKQTKFSDILKKSGVQFDSNGKILIPSWVKHIKLDIGLSYSAPHTQVWLTTEPDTLVFGFECNPYSVASICSPFNKKFASGHGDVLEFKYINTRAYIIPVALGIDRCPAMKFYVTDGCGGNSSFFKPSEIETRFRTKEIIDVPVYTLADFFELLPDSIKYVDFIKIDAQGADLDILKGAGDWITKKVVFVTAESEVGNSYIGVTGNNQTLREYMKTKNFSHIKHLHTEDPTFVNETLLQYTNEVSIYQKG
jgi:FkbM family methyltransferase